MYADVAGRFPPVHPEDQDWVNVHDGRVAKVEVLADLIERHISSPEAVVLVHSDPGIAVMLPRGSAADYMAGFILEHELQASDRSFTCFVAVSRHGVATVLRAAGHPPSA